MITASHGQLMAQYNEWMNTRLYAVCASLPDIWHLFDKLDDLRPLLKDTR
jgi:uncharacterized damage-inducible protein DinB